MSLGWKKFNFFERIEKQEHALLADSACSCSSTDWLYLGSSTGQVHVIGRELEEVGLFSAHQETLLFLEYVQDQRLLISLGVDDGAPKLKVWSCKEGASGRQQPSLLRTIEVFAGKSDITVITQVAVHHSKPQLVYALGLADGSVLVLRADTGRDKLVRASLDGHSEGSAQIINGLAFAGQGSSLQLYVETSSQTLLYDLTTSTKSVLDEMGAEAGSITTNPQGELVVARPEAIYLYTPDGRGPCFVFEGKKQEVQWVRQYLVAVTSIHSASLPTTSHALQLFDLKNKFIAAIISLTEVPKLVVVAWGTVIVLQQDDSLFSLKERPLAAKLDLLCNKSLYALALNLAHSERAENKVAAEIQSRYANHLYNKHDYDGAMTHYLETIGHLEPSFVIRRFLDAQSIYNLTSYLEALHEKGLASTDHTTLLLNCYTKLKDVDKLDKFLKAGSTGQEQAGLHFDVDTAIKVCRTAGYHRHALDVAQAARHSEMYLEILIADCKEWDEAIAYLQSVPRKDAAAAMQKFGKVLVTQRPEATAAILMQLCTAGESKDEHVAEVASFTHLFDDRPQALLLLCEFIINSTTSPPSEDALYHTLLQLYLTDDLDARSEDPSKIEPSPQARRNQAAELLRRGWQPGEDPHYNPDKVLVLCSNNDFKQGLVFLYEKLRLFREVLRVYMAAKDYSGLIDACSRLGDASKGGDPQLWTEILEHLTKQDEDVTLQIQEVLSYIEAGGLLPPLVILQILAKNPRLKLSLIKDYLARQLQAENASIEEDQRQIEKYERETQAMREEVHDLKTKARVFQNTKCAVSGAPLELPAVHFLCGHSCNLRSLGDNERECPLCAPHFRTILDIRKSLRAGASEQDKFFSQLRSSADGFSVIADFFGRGLINNTSSGSKSAL